MLIRRPAAEVFQAFADPAVTTSSGSPGAAAGWNPVPSSPGTGRCTASPPS
ncbi:hypothetical protein V2I01_26430 [Micromonospora sp. BRA006-A]|nr:hypothetical protein [Micromonospora sp. BRA006-A]